MMKVGSNFQAQSTSKLEPLRCTEKNLNKVLHMVVISLVK